MTTRLHTDRVSGWCETINLACLAFTYIIQGFEPLSRFLNTLESAEWRRGRFIVRSKVWYGLAQQTRGDMFSTEGMHSSCVHTSCTTHSHMHTRSNVKLKNKRRKRRWILCLDLSNHRRFLLEQTRNPSFASSTSKASVQRGTSASFPTISVWKARRRKRACTLTAGILKKVRVTWLEKTWKPALTLLQTQEFTWILFWCIPQLSSKL